MTLQIDFDVIWIDVHVFGQHSHQVALQSRQIVGLGVTACTLVGEDELQTFFGHVGSFFLLTEQESCLLYTSPSPRDLSTSRMPSSA